jgi:hypothetical protein
LYLLDWDKLNGGRSERVDVLDANNPTTILDMHTVSSFSGGEYLVWTISGHVLFRVTNLLGGNFNAVASGLFFGTIGSPQLAAHGPGPGGHDLIPLTNQALTPILEAAEERWIATGLAPGEIQQLRRIGAVVTDLPAGNLGRAPLGGSVIYLDANGAGYGWFIDPTPMDDAEFPLVTVTGLHAAAGSPAAGRMDLLTVVLHELGHVLGLDSVYGGDPAELMDANLDPGERRLPSYLVSGLVQSTTAVEVGHETLLQSSPAAAPQASHVAALETAGSSSAETAVPTPGKTGVGFREWTIPDWWFLSEGLGRTKQQPWDTDEVIFAA